jgi:hypothetical protein
VGRATFEALEWLGTKRTEQDAAVISHAGCPSSGSHDESRALHRAARERILATPMDRNNKSDENAFVIKADDDIAKGRFSNFAQVGSTPDAFVLDFSFVQGPAGWLLSRIMLSPQHAKRLSVALAETIAKHEERFGKIDAGPTLQ